MPGIVALQDSDYKCSLSGDVFEKAKTELKEDPDTRLIEVKLLRQKLEKISGLQYRSDVGFLLPFLRARKFNQQKACDTLKNFYSVRIDQADVFDDIKPSRIKHVIDDGVLEVLKGRDKNGCMVVVLRPGRWDPDRYSSIELSKAMYVVLNKLAQDEETQVHGIHFINNLAGVTMKQARHITPSMAKRTLNILQNVVPLRLKRLDYVNEPVFFDAIFAIVRQFMKDKLVKRIVMNGSNFDGLKASIDSEILPKDLGGNAEPFTNKAFLDDLFASDQYFEEDNKFGFVKMEVKKKKSDKGPDADMAGLGGTFKKLDV